MVFIVKPQLKIANDKLYISREPGIMSWLLFILTIIVFTTLLRHLTSGISVLTIFILGEIIFGLDSFGEWEEVMLDKSQNSAIFKKYSWCDKLLENPEKYIFRIKLSDIRHVGVSQNMGLFMLPRNGKAMTFSTRGLSFDEVQNIKKEINFFLNSNRIEYVERKSADLGDHLLNLSDSDEYLQLLLGKCSHRSIPQELPISTSNINRHNSTPLLGTNSTAERYSEKFLSKRFNGTHNILQTIPPLNMRHRNWVPKR